MATLRSVILKVMHDQGLWKAEEIAHDVERDVKAFIADAAHRVMARARTEREQALLLDLCEAIGTRKDQS